MTILIVIPARGGSKGIPRKNLRPLAGKPMLFYSINAALKVEPACRVVVTTDDDEIALFAERFGASVVRRPAHLADDKTTLDPVILDAMQRCEQKYAENYELIVTVQPTSPLVTTLDIEGVISKLASNDVDSALTVVDDRHLCWTVVGGKPVPVYQKRVNRQQLAPNFRETGAVIACTRAQIVTGTRIGPRVSIYEVPQERSFDIDSVADLCLCEAMLARKRIVITVVGYAEVGLGHAYRGLMIAHELVQYELIFVCEERSDLAISHIRSNNYRVVTAADGKLLDTVLELAPDLVINDILDTTREYVGCLKERNITVVNFEDMGSGIECADLVINALYPHQLPSEHVLVGAKWFCLRDEFLYMDENHQKHAGDPVKNILITFGGVDEGNITERAFREVVSYAIAQSINVEIVIGPGYPYTEALTSVVNDIAAGRCRLVRHTQRISSHMSNAQLAITSGGRTVLELAALNVPTIVVCQNDRELTHTFASSENGVINLGHREHLASGAILDAVKRVVEDERLRVTMHNKMARLDLSRGKARVISKIKSLLHR